MKAKKKATKPLHERRKVTFQELGAFYAVRAMVAAGVLQYDSSCSAKPHQHTINMRLAGEQTECGTIGCIGGNMALVMGISPGTYIGHGNTELHPILQGQPMHGVNSITCSRALLSLFFPPTSSPRWRYITAKQMLAAMDNWLKDGKPRWRKVLRGH